MERKITKKIMVGDVSVGGGAAIAVQSMLSLPPEDIQGNLKQALLLEQAGCNILRVAIPDMKAVKLIYELKKKLKIPLVADIHFDYRLAVESVMAGTDKVRINPGNIGDSDRVKRIVDVCKLKNVPIRIGVNSGSLQKDILEKYEKINHNSLCESACGYIKLLEKFDFTDIVISIKASNIETMVKACELISEKCDYPLHLGVTEAGTARLGIIKTAVGIGALLLNGIGDTIRISLTADPLEEIVVARNLLKALEIDKQGIQIISCPTCGRTKVNLLKLVEEMENRVKNYAGKNLKIAIMGCVVNGPGEASEADIGVTCGDGVGVIFKKGKIVRKVKEDEILDELIKEIKLA
jgi:(E)-4-hydroxy-3-methylbut-2-enyl-diphosphate synthase